MLILQDPGSARGLLLEGEPGLKDCDGLQYVAIQFYHNVRDEQADSEYDKKLSLAYMCRRTLSVTRSCTGDRLRRTASTCSSPALPNSQLSDVHA